MKWLIACLLPLMLTACSTNHSPVSLADRQALVNTTQAIREAFARGDVPAIVALHHPEICKYFGGNNVVNGRAALEKGLTDMFSTTRLEFVEHKLENLVFTGNTAIETSIFGIKATDKKTGKTTLSRGRAMVVYVRYKNSPTGWASLREMAQAAPED